MLTINKTGLLTMEAIDIYRYLFDFKEDIYIEEQTEPVIKEEKKEYNVYNIDFDKLISETTDNNLINMHKYFQSVEPTEKNKYTGMFKGKNLIFIMKQIKN